MSQTIAFFSGSLQPPLSRSLEYAKLEHRGLAAGRPGLGTFVRGAPGTVGLAELTTLRKSLLAWLRTAGDAGLDEPGMVALFTSALRDFEGDRGAVPPGTTGP